MGIRSDFGCFARSPETFCGSFLYLPGNFALKTAGDFSGLRFPRNEERKLLKNSGKFGANSGQNSDKNSKKFGELSFCNFSDLLIFVPTVSTLGA